MSDGYHLNTPASEANLERIRLENLKKSLEENIDVLQTQLSECKRDLYEVSMRELILREIYRLAAEHFPRLRRDTGGILTEQDLDELEKWIKRAKSVAGLKDIADALGELEKYKPVHIKSNLYALVQKIIIGGAYHEKKKRPAR
jgi:hypothetical protein